MEQSAIFDTIRTCIRQGDTATALQHLHTFLSGSTARYEAARRTLHVIESDYHLQRQQSAKGTLSFEELQRANNKTNAALLDLLDDIQHSRHAPASVGRSPRRQLLLGASVLLVAAGIVAFIAMRRQARIEGCPTDAGNKLRVLIMPFTNMGDRAERPALALNNSMTAKLNKRGIPAETGVYKNANKAADFDDKEVLTQAKHCSADVVVWGQYKSFTNDSIYLRVQYQFLGGNQAGNATNFEGFKNVTTVEANYLEDMAFSLCATLALRKGQSAVAKDWLSKIKQPDAHALRLNNAL
jgi:Effector-associated domain 11